MFAAVELRARDALRRGVLAVIGGVLVMIGLGFLTHAAWLALAAFRDPIFAAQVVGGFYVLVGGLLLFRSRRRHIVVPAPAAAPPQPAMHLMLVEAFLVGLDAARATRRSRAKAD